MVRRRDRVASAIILTLSQRSTLSIPTTARPPLAVASIIVSMAFMAASNGMFMAFIPLKLSETGAEPWVAGAVLSSMSVGGFIACFVMMRIIQRVGHARTFLAFAALNILHAETIALFDDPLVWCIARAVYGFVAVGFFVVVQSWLNDTCTNEWRGRVTSIFYMSYVISLGAGSYVVTLFPLEPQSIALLVIASIATAMIPIGMTRLPPPSPPEGGAINLRLVWRISPVGFMGMFAVGGLTMLVQGFAPIYATEQGFGKTDVGLLLFLMQLGLIGVQLPMGIISDRIDRRWVLVATCLMGIICAFLGWNLPSDDLLMTILVFAIWVGATETIYAVSGAHANDRADPDDYVTVATTLMFIWSISALIIPLVATALTGLLGVTAFMGLAGFIAALYGIFVALRITRREATPDDAQEPYRASGAQVPLTADLAPVSEDPQ